MNAKEHVLARPALDIRKGPSDGIHAPRGKARLDAQRVALDVQPGCCDRLFQPHVEGG
jgi:hypothetical protein